jgi:acyl carrier protein
MMNDETVQTIRRFVLTSFYVPEDEFTDDASLIDNGIVDSTGVLEVTAFLESTFGISVADAEIIPENMESIERLAAFVGRKRAETRRPTGATAIHEARA